MKKTIKLVTIVMICICLLYTNVKAFTIDPNQRVYIVYDEVMPYHYEAEEKVNYKMLQYKDTVLYTFNRDNSDVITLLTNQEIYSNPVCEKILENGYPAKTYQELGVNNEIEAYFATQEAIYALLEKKDVSKYIAENEEGSRILTCMKQILTTSKKEEVGFKKVSEDWKIEPENIEYMYEEYQIILDSKIQSATIKLKNANNVNICTQENEPISTVKNGDIIKIMVPRRMNQTFQVTLSYNKDGAKLNTCYNSSYMDIKYLASQIGQVQKEASFEVKFNNLATVTISNYDNETKDILQGSTFSILNQLQEVVIEDLTTNEEGKIQTFLEKGDYYLKQIHVESPYSLTNNLINFTIKNKEKVDLNVYNSKIKKEETTQNDTQINISQEDKQIIENNVTDVTNIHTTNTQKEIINQINETNINQVNHFVNTINRKNVNNITKENTYDNEIWEEIINNEILSGENQTMSISRDEYITYIDFIKSGSLEVPNLPVALRQ